MAAEKRLRTQTVEKQPVPPDGGYGWVILFASFVISFIADGVMYSFGIILPDIGAHFKVSQSDTNLLTSLYTGFLFLSGPIVAGLSNALGVRSVVMGGALVTALMFVASAYAPNIIVMYFLYGVIGGIATGCCYLGSLIIVAQYFDKRRGLATGICMSGSGFGSFGIAPFIAFLLEKYDWQVAIIVCGSCVIQCCIMGALMRPVPTILVAQDPNLDVPKQPLKADAPEAVKANPINKFQSTTSMFQSRNSLSQKTPVYLSENLNSKNLNITAFAGSMVSLGNFNQTLNMKTLEEEFMEQSWYEKAWQIIVKIAKDVVDVKLLFQNLEFFFIVMCNFFCFNALFIPYIYIPKHGEMSGLTKSESAWILSVIGIVNIPMRLFFGFVADRKILTAVNLNTIAIAIASISVWIIGFLTTFPGQIAFGVIFAFGTAGSNALCNSYISEIVGSAKFNNALGITNLFRGIACFLGPFLGGKIAESFDNYLYAFYFSAACFTIAGLMSIMVTLTSFIKGCCNKKTKSTEAELANLNANKA